MSPGQARSLARDPARRRELAEQDPTAIFGALSALPLERPLPRRPELPAQRPAMPRSRRRLALAVAASLLAAAGLGFVAIGGWTAPDAVPAAGRPLVQADLAEFRQVVRRVESRTAQVVVLVPPSEPGPTVTMIIDEENGL